MNHKFVYLLIPLLVATPTMAFAEISLSSYYDAIDPKERLLVTGNIQGDIQEFKPVKLIVFDPAGDIIYEPELKISGDGDFKYMITPTVFGLESGEYTIEASHEDLAETATIQFTVNDFSEKEDIPTEVIPEFGTVATMVLVVAVISIVAITSKTRGMSFNV